MFCSVNLKDGLTLGELRRLLDNELLDFPDEIKIVMCVNPKEKTCIEEAYTLNDNVVSIIGDEKDITFYNYI